MDTHTRGVMLALVVIILACVVILAITYVRQAQSKHGEGKLPARNAPCGRRIPQLILANHRALKSGNRLFACSDLRLNTSMHFDYCVTSTCVASTAYRRNVAYFSPILSAAWYSSLLNQAFSCSRLSHC